MRQSDPVHVRDGKYYFWDETWSHEHGPFDSEMEVYIAFGKYLMWLNDGNGEPTMCDKNDVVRVALDAIVKSIPTIPLHHYRHTEELRRLIPNLIEEIVKLRTELAIQKMRK